MIQKTGWEFVNTVEKRWTTTTTSQCGLHRSRPREIHARSTAVGSFVVYYSYNESTSLNHYKFEPLERQLVVFPLRLQFTSFQIQRQLVRPMTRSRNRRRKSTPFPAPVFRSVCVQSHHCIQQLHKTWNDNNYHRPITSNHFSHLHATFF